MKKKIVTLCLAAALAVTAIGGTLAYFTAEDEATNTFTVGDIDITLTETNVDEDGQAIDGRNSEGNTYHLFPGGTYDKDPMVTVKADSEESYIRMLVTVNSIENLKAAFTEDDYYKDGLFLLEKIVSNWDETVWECVGFNSETDTYEFRYTDTVDTLDGKDLELAPLFTHVVIPGSLDNDAIANLNNVSITIKAEAIQVDGFDSADAAWKAFPAE